MGRMERFSDKTDWDEFMAEQVAMTGTVIRAIGRHGADVELQMAKDVRFRA